MLSRALLSLLALCVAGCQNSPADQNASIARTLVGQWVSERGDAECRHTALEAFRADGTMTSTDERCDFISDGFGNFDYGWYVAEGHLCLVDIPEQFSDRVKRPAYYRERFLELVKRGFVEDACFYRVDGWTRNEIRIVPRDPELRPFTMKRKRWL